MSTLDLTSTEVIDWQYPNPFLREIEVLPEHTDQLGHTNNVRYLEWLESIAWDHIGHLGCDWQIMDEIGKAFAITRTEMNYLTASYKGDKLILATWIVSTDQRIRSTRKFQLVRVSDGKEILTAQMDFASIILKNGRPTKMAAPMLDAINQGVSLSNLPTV